ncbi:MAG: chemotaxis protein CheB [Scytonema sp. PMC 1069.18]|nr:chemotaxis protein CheB [Scytonema sp. PMC 1069.18]MEC4885229.1 chemotaxis protein CheB [Scytonema sp. PMC 1070.18]
MSGHDIIVIGASAGGVEALIYLVKNLPSDLKATVAIVLHIPSHGMSVLPHILQRAGNLPAVHANDREAILPGRIYIAPPDYHLLIKQGYFRLTRGPRENNHRPAIDPLFRSAARVYGQRVIGVILTGVLDDGTAGLQAVKIRKGIAVVQDPEDAMYSGMPRSAIENVDNIDHVLPLSDIPAMLVNLVNTPIAVENNNPVPRNLEFESDVAEVDMAAINDDNKPGNPSPFACPDCGGTLWDLSQGDVLRFRCRTGHAFSAETLLAKQSDALEDALWIALRALEEKASLSRRMANRMRDRNQSLTAQRFDSDAQDALARASVIRDVLLTGNGSITQIDENIPPVVKDEDITR